jgi:hypothetical protein
MPVSARMSQNYAGSSRIAPLSSSDQTSVVEPPTSPPTTPTAVTLAAPTPPSGQNLTTKSQVGSPMVPTLTETTCWYAPPPLGLIHPRTPHRPSLFRRGPRPTPVTPCLPRHHYTSLLSSTPAIPNNNSNSSSKLNHGHSTLSRTVL